MGNPNQWSAVVKWLMILAITIWPQLAAAYTFKCDPGQRWCYVNTKRMVPGDYVGIFDRSKRLIAIGKVDEIIGETRQIRIIKRYGTIKNNFGLSRIEDEVVAKPGKYYTIYRGPAKLVMGVDAGVASIGIGEGLAGFTVEAHGDYRIAKWLFATGRVYYLYGRGEAAIEEGEFVSREIDMSAIGGLLGAAIIAEPVANLYLRAELSVGVAGVFGDTADGVPLDEAVEGRVSEGFGFGANVGISAIWQRKGSYQPFVSGSFLRVQEANVPRLSLGLRFNL